MVNFQHTLGASISSYLNYCRLWALLSALSPIQDLSAKQTFQICQTRTQVTAGLHSDRCQHCGSRRVEGLPRWFNVLPRCKNFMMFHYTSLETRWWPSCYSQNCKIESWTSGPSPVNAVEGFCSTINSMGFTKTFRQQDEPMCRPFFWRYLNLLYMANFRICTNKHRELRTPTGNHVGGEQGRQREANRRKHQSRMTPAVTPNRMLQQAIIVMRKVNTRHGCCSK